MSFVAPGSGELGLVFRSGPGQLAASVSDPSTRLREIGPVMVISYLRKLGVGRVVERSPGRVVSAAPRLVVDGSIWPAVPGRGGAARSRSGSSPWLSRDAGVFAGLRRE